MPMPTDIKIIDLMMGIPAEDNSGWYEFIKPLLMDEESHKLFKMPAQYMFKDIPQAGKQADYAAYVVEQMDKHNIERAMLGVDDNNLPHQDALKRFPERFFCSYEANPNRGMDEVRKIRRLHKEYGIKAVTAFPSWSRASPCRPRAICRRTSSRWRAVRRLSCAIPALPPTPTPSPRR